MFFLSPAFGLFTESSSPLAYGFAEHLSAISGALEGAGEIHGIDGVRVHSMSYYRKGRWEGTGRKPEIYLHRFRVDKDWEGDCHPDSPIGSPARIRGDSGHPLRARRAMKKAE